MNRYLKYITLLFVIPLFGFSDEPEDRRLRTINSRLEKFNSQYFQQKVYIHTDRDEYTVADDIWFKAYVINGMTHQRDSQSVNLYVELINPRNQIIQTKRLRLDQGIAHGDFFLQDTLPRGIYKIRAYTNWMNNFDQSFLYTKNIQINNPGFKIEKNRFFTYRKINRNIKRKAKKTNVQFFPEGGDLIHSHESHVAFKAINGLGEGIPISGKLVDNKKNVIVEFSSFHKGMGGFRFTPDINKKYKVIVKYDDGQKQTFKIPEIKRRGLTLGIENQGDQIHGHIFSNRLMSEDRYANEVILTAHVRGRIYYQEIFLPDKDNIRFVIPNEKFPNGVVHFTLFNGRTVPVAERLVFINHNDFPGLNIKQNQPLYHPKEKIELELSFNEKEYINYTNNLSVSVTDAGQVTVQPNEGNILNFLLLTSDLKGHIEDPGFYFSNNRDSACKALDYLMLTQGWRRFSWNKLIAGEFPEINHRLEKGISISGKITRELFGIPLKGAKVTLTILDKYNDFYTTTTPKNGRFEFRNLNYADTVSVKIEAERENGRKNLVIMLNEGKRPELLPVNDSIHYTREDIKRPVYVKSPVKTDEETDGEPKQIEPVRIYGEADNVIEMDDIPDGYSDLLQVLQGRVPGLNITGNQATIRGIGTIYGSTDPLLLIDGIPSDFDHIQMINPQDVEKIEILKGPNTAIYGSRGGNGVIAIYTKRGRFMKKGVINFDMLGYYTPREFYIPKYKKYPNLKKIPDHRKTIYWNPRIETVGDKHFKMEFYNSNAEKLRVHIEGITEDGKPVSKTMYIP